MDKILVCGLIITFVIIGQGTALSAADDYFDVYYNYLCCNGCLEMCCLTEDGVVEVLVNDLFNDNEYYEMEVVDQPTHGLVKYTVGHNYPALLYIVTEEGYIGEDSFTYCLFNGINYSNIATVSINVIPHPDPWFNGKDVNYFTPKDTELSHEIPNSRVFWAETLVLHTVHNGNLIVNQPEYDPDLQKPSSFRYTPNPDFSGIDNFTYALSYESGNGLLWGLPGHVTIYVGRPMPLSDYTNPPTDPDNDGIYEDLNGNGRLDFADVVIYFTQMQWIAENEPVEAFDLNGNARIDFADIVALFNEV